MTLQAQKHRFHNGKAHVPAPEDSALSLFDDRTLPHTASGAVSKTPEAVADAHARHSALQGEGAPPTLEPALTVALGLPSSGSPLLFEQYDPALVPLAVREGFSEGALGQRASLFAPDQGKAPGTKTEPPGEQDLAMVSDAAHAFEPVKTQPKGGGRFQPEGNLELEGGLERLSGLEWRALLSEPDYVSHREDTGFVPTFNAPPELDISGLSALLVKEEGVRGDDTRYSGDANTTIFGPELAPLSGQPYATDTNRDDLRWGLSTDATSDMAQSLETVYGEVRIDSVGRFTYTLDPGRTDHLSQGEQATDSFFVVVSDGSGGTVRKEIVINIEGTNDKPEISFATGNGLHDVVVRPTGSVTFFPAVAEGKLEVTDADADGAPGGLAGHEGNEIFSIMYENVAGTSSADGGARVDTPFGSLVIHADGSYVFTPLPDAVAPDQRESLTFDVTVTDAHGSTASISIVVDLHGEANHTPIFGQMPTLALQEEGVAEGGNVAEPGIASFAGSFADSITDADGDALTYGIIPPAGDATSYATSTAGGVQTIVTPYGTLALDVATGQYVYVLNNNNPALQRLTADQSVTETFTLTVDDGYQNGKVSQSFTVVIQGTNDAPTLTLTAGGLHTSLKDSPLAVDLVGKGSFAVHDQDAGSALGGSSGGKANQNFTVEAGDGAEGLAVQNADGSVVFTSKYGTLSIDKDGNYTYTVNRVSSDVVALGANTTHTESFVVRVKDAHGALSEPKTITVQITGKDDPPTFIDDNYALSLKSSGVLDFSNTATNGVEKVEGQVQAKSMDADKSEHVLTFRIDPGSDPSFVPGDPRNGVENGIQTIVTKYGLLMLDTSTGKYTFMLDNTLAAVRALKYSDTIPMRFKVNVTDTDEPTLSRTQDFSISIAGTNDAPENHGVIQAARLEEDGQNTASGRIDSFDWDSPVASRTHSLVENGTKLVKVQTGKYGWIELNPDGSYTYHLDNTKAQGLSDGEGEDRFVIRITDDRGAYTETELRIPITGHDDAPTFSGTLSNSVREDNGFDVNHLAEPPTVTGFLSSSDVDEKDTQRRYVLTNQAATSGEDADGKYMQLTGSWGTLKLYGNGRYLYTLDENAALQYLNIRDTETDIFGVRVESGHDGTMYSHADNSLHITINGVNDKPVVLQKDANGNVLNYDLLVQPNPDGTGGVQNQSGFGTLQVFDPDDATRIFYFTDANWNGSGNAVLQSCAGKYGVMVVDKDTGIYTYTIDPYSDAFANLYAEALLNPGALGYEQFTVRVRDPHGAWSEQVIEVNIDPCAPPVTGPYGYLIHKNTDLTLREDDYNPVSTNVDASGQASFGASDPNLVPVYGFEWNGKFTRTVMGKYGSIIIDNNGKYTYTLNTSMAEVQALAKDEILRDEFTFHLWGERNNPSGSKDKSDTINIIITGTNDVPEVTRAEDSTLQLEITQNNVLDTLRTTVTGTIKGHDIDTSDNATLKYYLLDGNNKVTSITRTGYTITIDENTGIYTFRYTSPDLLNKDQSQEHNFQVVVVDAQQAQSASENITVTVNGVNTPPVITRVDALTVKEDVTTEQRGGVAVTDDTSTYGLKYGLVSGANASGQGSTLYTGKYGTLMIINPTTGEYKYVLNNEQREVNALDDAGRLTETFYLKVTDKHGGTTVEKVEVSIEGRNDAPELSLSHTSIGVTETSSGFYGGVARVSDPDDTANFKFALENGTSDSTGKYSMVSTAYGTLYMDKKTGAYFFELDTDSATVKGLRAGQNIPLSFKVSVTDDGGASSQGQNIHITVQGKDSPPEFSTAPNDLSLSASGTSATGTTGAFDPDYQPGTSTHYGVTYQISYRDMNGYTQIVQAGGTLQTRWGQITIDANGKYTYTLTDEAGRGQKEYFTITALSEDNYHAQTSDRVTVNIGGTPPITRSVLAAPDSDAEHTGAEQMGAAHTRAPELAGPDDGPHGTDPADVTSEPKSHDGMGDDRVPPQMLEPEKLEPKASRHESPMPDLAAPEDTAPEDTAPEDTAPEDTAPEDTAPEGANAIGADEAKPVPPEAQSPEPEQSGPQTSAAKGAGQGRAEQGRAEHEMAGPENFGVKEFGAAISAEGNADSLPGTAAMAGEDGAEHKEYEGDPLLHALLGEALLFTAATESDTDAYAWRGADVDLLRMSAVMPDAPTGLGGEAGNGAALFAYGSATVWPPVALDGETDKVTPLGAHEDAGQNENSAFVNGHFLAEPVHFTLVPELLGPESSADMDVLVAKAVLVHGMG